MKKQICIVLAFVMLLMLCACGNTAAPETSSVPAVAPLTGADYTEIIRANRNDELNEVYNIIADGKVAFTPFEMEDAQQEEAVSALWMLTGLSDADMQNYAISASLMNVRAYACMIIKPADGKTDAVMAALQEYVDGQKRSFENYLIDQYDIAAGAVLRETKTGEVILVMDENADALADALEKALQQ